MAEAANVQDSGKQYRVMEKQNNRERGREASSMKSDVLHSTVVTQDFHRLLEAFTNQIKLAVPCDGIKFRANNMDQHFVAGVLDHYLCCFAIKVGDKSFGTIYFARATQFIDSELTILENMVAGLVLPLCHLFQTEILHDFVRTEQVENEPFSISGTSRDRQV